MFKGLDHFIYFVNDLNRAKDFYQNKLGLPVLVETPGFVSLRIGDQMIGLHLTETGGKDVGYGGIAYLLVEDMDSTLANLREQGIVVHREPIIVPGGKIATILDSEENALGLYERK